MNRSAYLPSPKFTLMVSSLALSVGLVYAAEWSTHPPAPSPYVAVDSSQSATANNSDWEATLYSIQAQNASSSLVAPSQNAVSTLLQAAQSANITDSVARRLFINLSNAKSQGLGDDIPTQSQIVADAAAQVTTTQAATSYTLADLTIVPTSNANMHEYGNAVMQSLAAHPDASEKATFLAIDYTVEAGDKTQGPKLAAIGAAYKAAATDLLAVAVPQTLAPLHLEIINNLLRTSATYADMKTIGSDPVRGLAGLQTYESLMDEGARVFTNIAQNLNKDAIIFTKDEPGSAWQTFVASP